MCERKKIALAQRKSYESEKPGFLPHPHPQGVYREIAQHSFRDLQRRKQVIFFLLGASLEEAGPLTRQMCL